MLLFSLLPPTDAPGVWLWHRVTTVSVRVSVLSHTHDGGLVVDVDDVEVDVDSVVDVDVVVDSVVEVDPN